MAKVGLMKVAKFQPAVAPQALNRFQWYLEEPIPGNWTFFR